MLSGRDGAVGHFTESHVPEGPSAKNQLTFSKWTFRERPRGPSRMMAVKAEGGLDGKNVQNPIALTWFNNSV